jgi:hypothetical protein
MPQSGGGAFFTGAVGGYLLVCLSVACRHRNDRAGRFLDAISFVLFMSFAVNDSLFFTTKDMKKGEPV